MLPLPASTLAHRAGVHPATVSRILRGLQRPSTSTAGDLARVVARVDPAHELAQPAAWHGLPVVERPRLDVDAIRADTREARVVAAEHGCSTATVWAIRAGRRHVLKS